MRVVITEVDRKIPLIKAVRELTGLGLYPAKALVEAQLPVTLFETDSLQQAGDAAARLAEAGAKAEILVDNLSGVWRQSLIEFVEGFPQRYVNIRRRQGWLQLRTRYFAVYLRFGKGAVSGDAG